MNKAYYSILFCVCFTAAVLSSPFQNCVDGLLVGSGKISKAAIYSFETELRARSRTFNATREEISKIISDLSHPETFNSTGINIFGTKFNFIKSDQRSVYGKNGQDGVIVVKTLKGVMIGAYGPPSKEEEAVKVADTVADYIIKAGY